MSLAHDIIFYLTKARKKYIMTLLLVLDVKYNMAFIYSRPRIRLPKFFVINNRGSSQNKKVVKLLLILLVIGLIIGVIVKAVAPVFSRVCIEKAKSIATIITNDETTNAIIDYQYSDFIIIHKDEDGNILMLESNMKNINIVISDVANRIQKSINNTKEEDVNISLGSFTGVGLLSGSGFKVPIRISTVGNVKTDVKSEFKSKGINQTLHRLYLEIETEISILTPFNTINKSILNQLILAENIIVGKIPETYYNLEGMTSDDVMEVMQ